jgi:ABC-type Fe3+ transport system permease subunit
MFTFWPKRPRRRKPDDDDGGILAQGLFCAALAFFLGLPLVMILLDALGML